MSAVIPNFLTVDDAEVKLFTVGGPNPGVATKRGAQHVLLVDQNGAPLSLASTAQGPDAHDAAVTGNPVLIGGYASSSAPTNVSTNGDAVRAWFLQNGAQVVNLAFSGTLPATGNGGVSSGVQRVCLANDSAGALSLVPNNAVAPIPNGLDMHRTISAASTNATVVRNTETNLYGWSISNVNAAACYVKFYNKATSPTVGTDTPVLTLLIPANGVPKESVSAYGITFTTGLSFAITTGVADSDTGAVAANEVVVNLFYKI